MNGFEGLDITEIMVCRDDLARLIDFTRAAGAEDVHAKWFLYKYSSHFVATIAEMDNIIMAYMNETSFVGHAPKPIPRLK